LDLPFKKRRVQQLVNVGLIAHTCLEAIARFVAELGYDKARDRQLTF
jgi:ureidoacrylate peracid hydrolase